MKIIHSLHLRDPRCENERRVRRNKTNKKLSPILLKNLNTNSQIGVIGHELAHIYEYNSKGSAFFFRLAIKHLSRRKMDEFEYNTDRQCIEHFLGYQLFAWSQEVRIKLKTDQWGGANNPKREQQLETTADYLFLTSLTGILVIILHITFNFIK